MTRMRWLAIPVLVILAAIAIGTPAQASIQPQGRVFEVWLEDYQPSASGFNSDLAFGVRFAYNNNERITYAGEAGYVSLSGEFSDNLSTTKADYTSWFADFITDINFAPKSKVVPVIFLGLGWAGESADAKSSGTLLTVSIEDAYDAGLTLQAGGALKIELGKKFDLRPGVRWRWFEARTDNDIDTEFLLGFGYRF